jgi:hypothetical protein
VRRLLVVSLLFVAVFLVSAGSHRVSFLQVGDPQIGYRCPGTNDPHPRYRQMTRAECFASQGEQLDAVLQFAEDEGLDFAVLLGDLVQHDGAEDQMRVIRDVLARHPNLDVYITPGNHDVDSTCIGLRRYLLNTLGWSPPRQLPHWHSWAVRGVHFFSLNSQLINYNAADCYQLASAGRCVDIDGNDGGSCQAGGDAQGRSTCAADEVCEDYLGYAIAQMAALRRAIAAFEADPDRAAFFLVSHETPWPANNANVQAVKDGSNAYHNMRECDDGSTGSPPYDYCSDFAGQDCRGQRSQCTVAVAGQDWRNQVEETVSALSTTLYGISGHRHQALRWSGTTVLRGVDYEARSSTGTSAPLNRHDDVPLSAYHWVVDSAGRVLPPTLVLATPRTAASETTHEPIWSEGWVGEER